MKQLIVDDIRSWKPCYDPSRHLSDGWKGTAVDLLRNESIPFADRLWCVLRTEVTSERVMRLFAVWSYRQTLAFVKEPDPRSVACADVAERFANGEATQEELETAWSAARSAARSAAWSAESAAWSAARSAQANQLRKVLPNPFCKSGSVVKPVKSKTKPKKVPRKKS